MQVTRRHGMTLIELMVALGILGLLTALATTGYQALTRNQRAGAASRSILLAAQEARQQARSTRQAVRLMRTTTVENGVSQPALRWEKPDCAPGDTWGSQCPRTECLTAACGTSGCTCAQVGDAFAVSPELDVSSLHGLCWLGETARPVAPRGSTMCDPEGTAPVTGSLRILRKRGPQDPAVPDRVLQVDALTGNPTLMDCELQPTAAGCTP
ncbi:prepilin-type N-terminal cleavage/methylation domain-containing protein [Myxococcus sp. XM-1-1-1]|uniref:prepilin-type N-terminal cleavage/methylation domain-containing protein n=1 Tax=Myxococcus sp. XM-1-1-1 TaxID=2874602 RepID=UPI001CBDF642|nr:prepilin-type N-terminal cleavage/methylation domain-containing protein [Myxococcus sp. XM-1-1-1]